MSRSVKTVFEILRILGKTAVALAVVAVIVGRAPESPRLADRPGADGAARVVVHDDGDSVRLAVGLAGGEAATRLVVEDPAGKQRLTLNLIRGGGAEIAFGQGGPNQLVAWLNADGTLMFSARSPKSLIEHKADPDGTARLAIHALPFLGANRSEVIRISTDGTVSHEPSVPTAAATRPLHSKVLPDELKSGTAAAELKNLHQ